MEKKRYSIAVILLGVAAFSLSSCLKENPYYVNLTASKPLVELPVASYTGPVQPETLSVSTTPQVFPLIVNVASPQLLTTSTAVVLEVDPTFSTASVLAAFNATNGTSCVLLPAADYSVPGWTVTIPPGEPHDAPLDISVHTNMLTPGVSYLLPIKISSAPYTVDQFNEVYFIVSTPAG
jgi:hypothetical protein